MAEKTKKLKAELFQVRAQLERTSSAKLDEMLSLQKLASDRIGLGYDFSSLNIASTSTTGFVSPTNNGAPPKLAKKETKNPRAKKGNTQKPK